MAVFMKRELHDVDLSSILYIDCLFLVQVLSFMITPKLLHSLMNNSVLCMINNTECGLAVLTSSRELMRVI